MAVAPTQQLNLDTTAQQSFVRSFRSLPEKPSTTIRFFNRVDYYTLHGSDALFAAQEIFKTTAVCKKIGAEPNKIDSLILNKNHFEQFIKDLLLVKQYRVEIYSNQGNSRKNDWVIESFGSPGNLSQFEDILFGNNDEAVGVVVIAVKLGSDPKSKVVGVSCIDIISTTISVCEFKDDESFSNLESLVVTLAPKECLLIQESSPDSQIVNDLMTRNNTMVTMRKRSEFSSDSVIQDLTTLIKFKKGQQKNAQVLPETNLSLAMSSTAALIKYLDLMGEDGNHNEFMLKQIEQSRFLRLNMAAIKALNIEYQSDGHQGSALTSVLALLDKCRTAQGHRMLAQWIRQPLRDLELIKERHDVVEFLINDSDLLSFLHDDHLRRAPDLQQLAKKMTRKRANLQDCYKIYLYVSQLPGLLEKFMAVSDSATFRAMFTDPLKVSIEDMAKYQEMVEQTIDMDAVDKGDFLVNAEFDEELKNLKGEIDEIEESIQSQLTKVVNSLGVESGKVKLESTQQFGYYFRITRKDEIIVRDKPKYHVFDLNTSGAKFRTDKLTELNDEYMALKDKYNNKQKEVVDEIVSIAAGYSDCIKCLGRIIATLDVLTSFAVAAQSGKFQHYIRPEMMPSETGEIHLIQARHPCLELQEGVNYIANDVHLKRKDSDFCIITGPNMGGKSTYIRSVAVVALMAHIGSFVPCDKAKISVLDAILARLGADDSQVKGMSTFMNEMVETAAILKNVTCDSLVIIDELGRGTSTYDGCGIAWAIADHLAREVNAYCLFATHFHEITRLAEDLSNVKNYHVSAIVEKERFVLLYKVEPGICDQSFGIHVAKMANFPEDIIEFAKDKQNELEAAQGIVFEGSDDPETKRKTIKAGEEIIKEFIAKCKSIDMAASPDAVQSKITQFKNEALTTKNPYIAALIHN